MIAGRKIDAALISQTFSAHKKVLIAGAIVLLFGGIAAGLFGQPNFNAGAGDAIDNYQTAIRKAPQDSALRHKYGDALVGAGRAEAGAQMLRAAYAIDPSPEIQLALAKALYATSDYSGALVVLDKTGEPKGVTPFARNAWRSIRNECLLATLQFSEIVESYEPGVAPPEQLFVAARAYYGLGDTQRAAAMFTDILKSGLADYRIWFFRARLALDENDLSIAARALKRAAEENADPLALGLLIGELKIRSGEMETDGSARNQNHPKKAKIEPTVFDLYEEGLLQMAFGDYVEAARTFDAIPAWVAQYPNGLLIHALAKREAGDLAQAERLVKNMLFAAPGHLEALDLLASIEIRRQDFESAAMTIDALAIAGGENSTVVMARKLEVQSKADHQAQLTEMRQGLATRLDQSGAQKFRTVEEFLLGPHFSASRERHQQLTDMVTASRAKTGESLQVLDAATEVRL